MFLEQQLYYADRSTGIDNINTSQLEGTPILQLEDEEENNNIVDLDAFVPSE